MIGLGGGLVFSPLFILLDMPKDQAVAASLFLNGIAAASAAIIYLRKRMIDFSAALPLLIASTLSAPVGAWATHGVRTEMFVTVLAVIIFLAALRMIFSRKIKESPAGINTARRIGGGLVIGAAIGFLGGMLGIGGGVFIVPLMIFVLRTPTKTAAASSIFIVCFSSASGFITHATLTRLDWSFLVPAALCAILAGQLGSRLMSERLKGETIRIMFGVVLILLSLKLISRALS
ncbi:MAG: sulfite exporter TauE/SafE family protein [Deltaproteobacteria bacterium]|nr:sulfite exporter TauE/SafE family protein [Deltaproteobacteria bacterium]